MIHFFKKTSLNLLKTSEESSVLCILPAYKHAP